MIERIHIKNFKSIYDLDINVGRINLFIGENGSGKSNLLEALVFVSAYQSNKLDNEFLVSRGLRVPSAKLMVSAFDKKDKNNNIQVIIDGKDYYEFAISGDNYSKWIHVQEEKVYNDLINNQNFIDYQSKFINSIKEEVLKNLKDDNLLKNSSTKELNYNLEYLISKKLNESNIIKEKLLTDSRKKMYKDTFENFIIYSPENTALRTFSKEGQIEPLGINGEGLLKLLKVVNNYEDKTYIQTIIESLQLFDWFEDIKIPDSLSIGEDKLVIKDKYLYKEIDQRSTNEGFLFILFYITLIVAKETPQAFAIDNIDASLNPKLCTKLMTIICDLAKKYDKQIFLTTHNPAILDGIDLNDKEQKLFVVSRNKSGHTRMKNITAKDKPKSSNDEPLKLSEAFLRGYLGGLPKGF
ncbi:MAG: AAA family ATPase [Aliarcobacter sp.]|jgi:predicted ATPase|nr:AAA family ATPase [Aliarcobacter sp.]